MLRVLVALLLGANVLFAAYQAGWLGELDILGPPAALKPSSPNLELHPERIALIPPAPVEMITESADTPAPETLTQASSESAPPLAGSTPAVVTRLCRIAQDLSPETMAPLTPVLESVLQDRSRWTQTETQVNGRWIVYIGKLSPSQLKARQTELAKLNIEHRVVSLPRLSPGLALGTYSAPERARNALVSLQSLGLRDARVEQERAPVKRFTLELKDLSAEELSTLESSEHFTNITLNPC